MKPMTSARGALRDGPARGSRRARVPATILALGLALSTAPPLAAQRILQQAEAVPAPRGTLLIEGLDAAYTAAGPVQRGVSILIRDGVIREIGANVSRPAGARVIDGRGLTAMPGIVDEHSHIAMASTNEGTAVVVPEVRVIDDLEADDFGIYRALSGGVTTAQVLHGSSNPIGGQSAIIKTRWGMRDARQLLLEGAPRTVKFALGENVTRKNAATPTDRFPASREGVEAVYVQAFTAAQEYRDEWRRYRADARSFPVPPRRDLRLEALVDIMEGRIRVHAHSYRGDEILMLIRVAERFGFTIDAFTHVLEGYKVADELARHGAGASTFSDWWMYKLEVMDAIPYNPAILYEHGVLTTLNSDIPWLQSFLVQEMQKPVKYGGVPLDEALRMLTLNAAKQLRIDHLVGSLEVGKQGDVVLLNGDPFNTFSRVEKTVVDGIVYYDRSDEEAARGEPVRRIAGAPLLAPPAPAPPPAIAPRAFEVPVLPATHKHTDPVAGATVTAIVGGTVHPVSGPAIENGVVVLEGERIAAVGSAAQVAIPAGARRVDATGQHVYPGLIDPLTSLGLVDIEAVPQARDDREVGRFNPHVRALWGVNPFSIAIPVARANGITSVLTIPASGIVRGAGSLIQLKGDTPEKMEIASRAALVVQFPRPKGEPWEPPSLEGDDVQDLLRLFRNARGHALAPSPRRDPTARFELNAAPSQTALLDALMPALRGEQPVIFIAQSERDIRSLLMFLDSFPTVKAVLGGGHQAYHVAGELARRDIPVIVGSQLTPTVDRDDPVTAAWRNAAILRERGVRVAFTTSFSPEGVSELRNLPYAAARAVAYGLPEAEALRALTLSAAEIMGLGAELGSLDPGKRADLIITTGSPLQILSNVERMWIAGEEMPLVSRHTELYHQFRNRGAGARPAAVAAPVTAP
ncbi:MAG TPA: amidohydrolase family protein [Longimicrobiales bacterium]|nr:amidohydrolase family protein [Longimicrobiales bacterium]